MLGLLRSSSPRFVSTASRTTRRKFSTPNFMESDTGKLGTSLHHKMTNGLAVMTPIYFLTPDSMTDGALSKTFGLLLSINITAHSWIGLNYVCRDYVPKISKALLGPARVACVGLSVVTLLGMAKISIMSPGGLKGVVKAAWSEKKE